MNKLFFSIVLLFSIVFVNAQEKPADIKLSGDVGGYKIEMLITSVNQDSATFKGKYKYLSQKNYLEISGINYGSCLFIEESYNGKVTGSFYLDRQANTLSGYWANETKSFAVNLEITSGNSELLYVKTEADYQALVSDKISGRYEVNYTFINDYFTTEENPVYEIGYNGGYVIVSEIGTDSISFVAEFICGPTYHFAIAEGVAVKDGEYYVYSADPYETDDFCEIKFKFGSKTVDASSNNSMGCGFGARAFIDHVLVKVKDE